MSFLELFVGFHLQSAVVLPVLVSNERTQTWIDPSALSAGETFPRTLGALVGVFRFALILVADVFGWELKVEQVTRPSCGIFKAVTGGCVSLA